MKRNTAVGDEALCRRKFMEDNISQFESSSEDHIKMNLNNGSSTSSSRRKKTLTQVNFGELSSLAKINYDETTKDKRLQKLSSIDKISIILTKSGKVKKGKIYPSIIDSSLF